MGIGQGFIFIPSLTIISHHFRRRKALATGIVLTGSSLGGIIFPIMLSKFTERSAFMDGVRASAGVVAVLLLLANCLMKRKMPSGGGGEKQTTGEVLGKILRDKAYWTSVSG
jgi:MCP family monocarboxylic acid transporter-like MFS transporter 10